MTKSQRKVAKIILRKRLSLEEATKINIAGGFLSTKENFIKLSKEQLKEAFEWAVHVANENDKYDRSSYLLAAILSFFMAPFAFSGFLEPQLIIAWAGQFVLGVLLVLSGMYFLREYLKITKKKKNITF